MAFNVVCNARTKYNDNDNDQMIFRANESATQIQDKTIFVVRYLQRFRARNLLEGGGGLR